MCQLWPCDEEKALCWFDYACGVISTPQTGNPAAFTAVTARRMSSGVKRSPFPVSFCARETLLRVTPLHAISNRPRTIQKVSLYTTLAACDPTDVEPVL